MAPVSSATLQVWAPWVFTIALQLGVVAFLRRTGSWKSIQAFCFFSSVKSIALMLFYARGMHEAYFYCFWWSQCIVYAIGMSVMVQVVEEVSSGAIRLWRFKHLRFTVPFCLVAVLLSAYVADPNATAPQYIMKSCHFFTHLATSFALICLVAAVWFLEFTGAAWKRVEIGIVAGIALLFAADAAWSLWVDFFPITSLRMDNQIRDVLVIFGNAVWAFTFGLQSAFASPTTHTEIGEKSLDVSCVAPYPALLCSSLDTPHAASDGQLS